MLNKILLGLLIIFLSACSAFKESAPKKEELPPLTEEDRVEFGRIYIEASKEKVLENYVKAGKLYQKALSINPKSAAAHYELGVIYGFLEENALAYEQFKMATEIEPENYWYKLSYATFLQAEGKFDESIKLFKQLAKENPTQVELKYELSKLLVNQKEYKESIYYLDKIEEEIGVTEEISFLKQRIYLSLDDVDKAAMEIEKLIESNPEEFKYYGILADIYLSNEKRKEALKVYERMKEIEPDNYLVHFSLAEFYRTEKNREKYWESIQKAFKHPEMSIDDKIKYFLNFYQIGNKDKVRKEEGIKLCEIIVDTHPESAKAHALYADFLYFDDQIEKAKEAYKKTISLDSSRFPVWNQLLVILSETNDIDGLINYGKRASELFPNQPSAYLLYGIGLMQAKENREAIQVLDYAKDLVVDNQALKSQIYSSIGDAYHNLKEHEKSDQSYEKALELDPNNVYVLNNYSYYLSVRKENLERAKEMSKKSNELAPNQSSFQDTYAWILYRLGNYKEAKEWIDKAIQNDASSPVLLEHKGDILFQLGEHDEAVEYWKKAKAAGSQTEFIQQKIEDKKLYE